MKIQMIELQLTETETIWVNEHFWNMISCFDERLKVLDYLMNHRAGKYAIGTIKEISKETGLSTSTVQKFLKALMENNLIQRHQNGVYILPPGMIPITKKGYECND